MLAFHVAFVVLLVGTQAIFTGLAVRNLRHSAETLESESDWLASELGIEDIESIADYNRLKTGLSHLQSWIGLVLLFGALYAGVFTAAVEWVDGFGFGPIGEGVVFFVGAASVVSLIRAPFDLVDTFAIDEVFDLNRQGLRLWLRDQLLGLVITAVIVAIVTAALLAFVEVFGWLWWVAGWAFFVLFSLAMNIVYPRVIAPLFNDFEPVEAGELREAVEEVFDRAGFTCSQIYTMDASRRSSRLNAYFIGFGRTKRVVLFDTLVDRLDLEAVQSVLAHELAHWKRKHIWRGLAASAVEMFVVFGVLGYLVGADWVYDLFGIGTDITYAGIALGLLWVGPLSRLASPISNRQWLRFEREADRFAVDVMGSGDGLIDALADLTEENLSNPFPHPWYEAFHYDHPPVPRRIQLIREYEGDSEA